MKMQLRWEEANPNQPDNDGQTPFMVATRRRYEKVVALLDPHKAMTPSTI